MINDDIIVKISQTLYLPSINGNQLPDWIKCARVLRGRIEDIKKGFPGIGDDDLSLRLLGFTDLTNLRFIYDSILMRLSEDLNYDQSFAFSNLPAPRLVYNFPDIKVMGIGEGLDLCDVSRNCLIGSSISLDFSNQKGVILVLESKAHENGGPAYYYFNKVVRDLRY